MIEGSWMDCLSLMFTILLTRLEIKHKEFTLEVTRFILCYQFEVHNWIKYYLAIHQYEIHNWIKYYFAIQELLEHINLE